MLTSKFDPAASMQTGLQSTAFLNAHPMAGTLIMTSSLPRFFTILDSSWPSSCSLPCTRGSWLKDQMGPAGDR